MEKYIKPETELIKVNTLYNICTGSKYKDLDEDNSAEGPALAPRYNFDDEDDTDVNSVW